MQVAARSHGDLPRLKRKPFLPPDHNSAVIDCVTENGSRKLYLAWGQGPLAPNRTSGHETIPHDFRARHLLSVAQRSSPAARTSTGKVFFLPPTTVSVMSVEVPACTEGSRSKTITWKPPG